MTIKEYLSNPTGRSDAAMMLGTIRRKFDQEFSVLQHAIRVKWYCIKDHSYVAHVRVPSSSYGKVFYDVLIEFDITSIEGNSDFRDKAFRVFSNCPSFTYTYARVFYNMGLLISWAQRKYNAKVLGMEPDKRNPGKIINYEKSLYFVFRYLNKHAAYYQRIIPSEALTVKDPRLIMKNIQSSDDIQLAVRKIHDKEKNKRANPDGSSKVNVPHRQGKSTKKVKHATKTSKATRATKKVKSIKKTKKI